MAAFDRLLSVWVVVVVLVAAGCAGGPGSHSESGDSVFDELPVGWSELPTPPEVHTRAAITWTGELLLVWGGFVYTGAGDKPTEASGFAFDARVRRWEQMATSPLAPRAYPASAWTGSEFLIWGGSDGRQERFFDDGAAYDPSTNSWRRLPQAPIAARAPLSAWTGRELIVWGTTIRVDPRPGDGAAYDPTSDTWRWIADAPIELTDATAVWTGREMIVFGAALHGGNFPESPTAIGAAYDPETNTWRELPDSALSPQASTAAWNGREVIAWDYLNGTAAYDPTPDSWRQLPNVPIDDAECIPTSVPLRRYVFGDYCGQLALYDPAADAWRDISRRKLLRGWGFELVAADPVVLLLGRNGDTEEERMLAYRPTS